MLALGIQMLVQLYNLLCIDVKPLEHEPVVLCFREKYSQYLRVQVCDSQGRSVREARSSFYHHLTQLSWVPTRRPPWDESRPASYLQPKSVYIFSTEVHQLLGCHVDYTHGAQMPSEFTRDIGTGDDSSQLNTISVL